MLSTKVFSSSSNAKEYYSHADYYGAEAKGAWFGRGAADFELKGEGEFDAKTSKEFKDILDGKMPDGRLLGNLEKDGTVTHRPGVDLTFSSPKSISIQMHILGNDTEKANLENARMKALETTLRYIEDSKTVYTRKGAKGVIKEPVDRLVFALFTHTTNRKLEPQDHVHCLLANATKCADGKYRTIVWDEVLRNNKLIGQVFRNEFALEVQKLGYEIRTVLLQDGSTSFELKHIQQDLIDAFSTRRKELVELFKLYDVKTKAGRDRIVINSRESKKTLSENKLKETWAGVVAAVEKERYQKIAEKQQDIISTLTEQVADKIRDVLDSTIYKSERVVHQEQQELTIDQVSRFALNDVTYHKSVFSREDISKAALKHAIGKYSIKDVERGIEDLIKTKEIVKSALGDKLLTSRELLDKEKAILKISKSGIGKSAPLIQSQVFEKRFKYHEQQSHLAKGFTLNKQQQEAVKHVLCSKDKVITIEGLPGVGKSTVLETVRSMSQRNVMHIGTSPTASASKTLQESSGIESKTLHSFLGKYRGYLEGRGTEQSLLKTQDSFKKTIVFVDEASLIGTRQMHDLLKLSEILKFRVVLVGDTKQLSAVEVGKPFEQVLSIIKPAKLTTIIRQKEAKHIEAIENVANSQILKSFKIHEENITDSKQFVAQAVRKYLSLSDKERDKTILISPSREHRDKINTSIVKHLMDKGVLGGTTQTIDTLKPVELTKSDYSFARSYKTGDIVKFNKEYKAVGIKKGDILTVSESNHTSNTLLFKTSFRNIRFQLNHTTDYASKLEVFQKGALQIMEGLKLKVTKNDNDLINSETIKVKELNIRNKTATIELEDKSIKSISLSELKHVDYGYCSTVHSAQGKTTDRLIGAISSHSKLNNQKSWLVSISRHKSEVHFYMQDKEKVQQQTIQNKGVEKSALDIIRPQIKTRQMSI